MKYLLIMFLSLNLFALDLTFDTDNSKDTSMSESVSNSKDKSIDKTKKKERTYTKTKDKSLTRTKKIDYDGKVKALAYLAGLEKAGVEPFASCRLLSKPHNLADFDLSCKNDYGMQGDLCSYLQNSATNYENLEEVIEEDQIENIKGYANCGILYGGIIAQYLKNGILNVEIKDKKLKEHMNEVSEQIFDSECNFADKISNIMCGSNVINIAGVLKLSANNYEIFGGNEYFGYKLNLSKDSSIKNSLSKSFVKSKAKSYSNKVAKSLKQDQGNSYKLSTKAAANLSVGKFVSAE